MATGKGKCRNPRHLRCRRHRRYRRRSELKTIKVARGFHVELVAGDPLVQDPVAIAFDPDGRIWVAEMSGFMPDVDANGEDKPSGRIVILEDTDGDGKMDKRTVFADGLVLPRAISLVRGGVLVAEPPKLWFMRDTHGDGKADEKTVVASDYGNRLNPEHTANGLIRGLDNWIYSADCHARAFAAWRTTGSGSRRHFAGNGGLRRMIMADCF